MSRTVLILNQDRCKNCSVPVLNAHSPWAVSILWRFQVVGRTETQQSVAGVPEIHALRWGQDGGKAQAIAKAYFHPTAAWLWFQPISWYDLTWYLLLFSHYQLQHLYHTPSLPGQPSAPPAQLICSQIVIQPLSSTYPLSWQLKPASFTGLHAMGKIYLDLHDITITPIYFYWLKIISKIKTIKLIRKLSYLTQDMKRIPIRKKYN